MDRMRNGQKILDQNPNVKRSLRECGQIQEEHTKIDNKYRMHEDED